MWGRAIQSWLKGTIKKGDTVLAKEENGEIIFQNKNNL